MAADKETSSKRRLSGREIREAFAIFRYLRPYRWAMFGGLLLLFLGSLAFMVIMSIPGQILNSVTGKETPYGLGLNELFIGLMVLLAVQSVMSYFRVVLFSVVSERGIADLRRDLYGKMITLDIPYFEKHRVGELTSRISNDTNQLQSVFSITIAEVLRQIILLLVGIVLIFVLTPKLAVTTLLTFPVVIVAALFLGRFVRGISKKRQDKLAETNVIVEETMQSIHAVKAYTNERFELARYEKANEETVQISLVAARYRGLMASFIILALFGALFFVMWRAAVMVQGNTITVGELFQFVLLTMVIGGAVASLGSFYPELVSAVGATERVRELLQAPSEIQLNQRSGAVRSTERFRGEVEFHDVRFSYPSRADVEVLKGLSFRVAPGEKIALVGQSGAGKSTVLQLLLRFYLPTNGTVSVDGQPLESFDFLAYRQNIAIVPQEVLLFGGTIRENIAYGKPGASEEEIIVAAKDANAWEFLSAFPEGLDTLVGERGIKLSGGQRQRIAIARAILKDPAILLLDEATSSLDAESEKMVQEALNRLMVGRTSIIIAHRLATIREVDCIYVLDQGRIAEKGTHEELSEKADGIYNGLAKLQFSGSAAL
jgi:ATP-binding cassette subfamily B protein